MRLKIIGVYGLLILALGASIWFILDLKLTGSQDAALRTSAERATAHTRRALEAEAMELVALASRAASVPELAQVLEQWRTVTSVDTRERLVKLFLTQLVENDQRALYERIAQEKGLTIPGAAPPAAPATPPAPHAVLRRPEAIASAKFLPADPPAAKRPDAAPAGGTTGSASARSGAVAAKSAPPGDETKAPAPAAAPTPSGTPAPAATTAAPAAAPPAAAPGAAPPPAGGEAAAAGTPAEGTAPAAGTPAEGAAAESRVITICKGPVCTDEEVRALFDLELLNLRTFLTDPKLGYEECRKAYLPDLEADQRRIMEEQVRAIEARRAAEAAAAAGGRRGAAAPPEPPPEVPFAPNREFDLGKYPACTSFFAKGQEAITNEMSGRIFSTLGYQVAALAYRKISDLTRMKIEFLWLLDRETGRGIAKNTEYNATTVDRYYYTKTLGELFEGLSGATGAKVLQAVRSGAVYRDIWVTREDYRDALTGFVHTVMVPVLSPSGTTVGLLALGVKTENLARVARDAKAKVVLARKTSKQGVETIQLLGDGNDDEKMESLPEGFRKGVAAAFDADLRAVAGIPATDKEGRGMRPPRDFEYGGTTYLARAVGLTNDIGQITRDDPSFAVGYLAMVVLVDKTHAMAALSSMWLVWLLTAVAFVIAIIAALVIAHGLLRPITQIEDGLLRIMNGDWTHRFDVQSAELGGLSYRINQLMAALLGDEEEGEAMAEETVDPREAYYRQLYEKFQEAQKQIRQDPNAVSFDDFRARLAENEKKILEKNPGKQVEFEILVQGNQITFKPILK